jgi:GWxTD domain-containing protein
MLVIAFLLTLFLLSNQDASAVAPEKAIHAASARAQANRAKQNGCVLKNPYVPWLEQDVRWIITPEESAAFNQLKTDEERDLFIGQFWLGRDPTPDTIRNEFKEEHYRRIAFANEHFAAGMLGSLADRGHIYIIYGPPDHVDVHNKIVGDAIYPAQTWKYRYIEGVGNEVELEFVDTCRCGEFKLEHEPTKEPKSNGSRINSFQFDILSHPPQVKFKDLAEAATHRIKSQKLLFDVRVDYLKVTEATTLVPITIALRNKEIALSDESGIPPTKTGRVDVFARLVDLTGRVLDVFEDIINVEEVSREAKIDPEASSQRVETSALPPGHYRLDVAVRDVNSNRLGTMSRIVIVPGDGAQVTKPQ